MVRDVLGAGWWLVMVVGFSGWVAPLAHAQDTSAAVAPAKQAPATEGVLAQGGAAWTIQTADLLRFSDAQAVSGTVPANTQVEVLVVDGQQVRVRRGIDFGWLSVDVLTASAPETPQIPTSIPSVALDPPQ